VLAKFSYALSLKFRQPPDNPTTPVENLLEDGLVSIRDDIKIALVFSSSNYTEYLVVVKILN
jgi:hypothetical protein